jgi:hypothetical protein
MEACFLSARDRNRTPVDAFTSDPFLRFLDAAPVDDEPVTAADETAVAEVECDGAARRADDLVRRRQAQVFGLIVR